MFYQIGLLLILIVSPQLDAQTTTSFSAAYSLRHAWCSFLTFFLLSCQFHAWRVLAVHMMRRLDARKDRFKGLHHQYVYWRRSQKSPVVFWKSGHATTYCHPPSIIARSRTTGYQLFSSLEDYLGNLAYLGLVSGSGVDSSITLLRDQFHTFRALGIPYNEET